MDEELEEEKRKAYWKGAREVVTLLLLFLGLILLSYCGA